MIPFYKIKTTDYPCKNSVTVLQIITFGIAFVFMLSICIYAYGKGKYLGIVIIFVLFLLSILLINFILIHYDKKKIRQILQILQDSSNNENIVEYLEYTKGRRFHCQLRRRPEILLLIGKIYENYYQSKGNLKGLSIAIDLVQNSVKYDPTLKSIAELDDLSILAEKISEKINYKKKSYFIFLLKILFKILLWMIIIFLIIASIANIVNIIVRI